MLDGSEPPSLSLSCNRLLTLKAVSYSLFARDALLSAQADHHGAIVRYGQHWRRSMATTELLTCAELAERLKVHPRTIRRFCKTGKIPAIRLGHRTVRFEYSAVLEALTPHEVDHAER